MISFRPSPSNDPKGLIAFCEGIQAAAPVDSYVGRSPGICRAMTAR